MSFCNRPTIATLMQTCRTLYREGPRFLLDRQVVMWGSDRQVASFCLFMLCGEGQRLRHLRKLAIVPGDISRQTSKALAVVLEDATNLEELTFHSSESILSAHHKIPRALSRIKSLRRLTLLDAGKVTCQSLRQIAVPLEYLKLTYGFDDLLTLRQALQPAEEQQYHPVVLCAGVAASLKELCIEDWERDIPLLSHDVVYPNLQHLTLTDDFPLVRPYIRCFPNLNHLTVRMAAVDLKSELWDRMDSLQHHRELNVLDQLRYGTWRHLKLFNGGILELFLLGLTCHIEHLSFHGSVERWESELLGPILDGAKPQTLELLRINGDLLDPEESQLLAALREHAAASVTRLSLHINLTKRDRELDMQDLMEKLFDVLACFHLESLRIAIHTDRYLDPTPTAFPSFLPDPDDPDGCRFGTPIPPTPHPFMLAEISLERFDHMDFAQRIAAAVPTVKSAVVVVQGPRSAGTRVADMRRLENGEVVLSEERSPRSYHVKQLDDRS
ncbi:hypothetical protein OH77DRAFT_1390256 [Trametes cingulata]|nr:hypothetical protein OH77DRAFT_1390256 [Trametes cingulata]